MSRHTYLAKCYLGIAPLLLLLPLPFMQTEKSVGAVINSVRENTIDQPQQYLKMGVPALLYTLQVGCR